MQKSGLATLLGDKQAWSHEMTKEFDEQGLVFSGGQMQRLAITRAFYKNAPVLVLDEITSALDTETEEQIMDKVYEVIEGKIGIMISHKLGIVKKASRILVLEKGRVVEEGSHQELVLKKGTYYSMFKAQADKYKTAIQQKRSEEWV